MNPRSTDDFYEDDEPLVDVLHAFNSGEKHLTAPPRGVTASLRLETPTRGLTETLRLPEALFRPEPRKDVPTNPARV